MTPQELKIEAAREALQDVRSGMSLGLGSGSTAEEFVRLLGDTVTRGRLTNLRSTCTSKKTEDLAHAAGLATLPLAEVAPIDLAIDGADEIDGDLRLVKGHGASLLREKIVEQQAKRFIVIADDSKIVDRLGVRPLPVEVTPFALDVLLRRFSDAGLQPALRMAGNQPRITDEGNRIVDVRVPRERDIADLVEELRSLAGVIETGFFPREATEAIIAGAGGVRRMRRT
jgi:ribose 5-phosphate isomerase A